MYQRVFSLTLPPDMRATIERLSAERRVTMGHIIREAVVAHYGGAGIKGRSSSLAVPMMTKPDLPRPAATASDPGR